MQRDPHPTALLLDFIARHRGLPPKFLSVDIETREHPELKALLPSPKEGDIPAVMLDRLEIICIQVMDVSGRTVILEGNEADVLAAFFSLLVDDLMLVTWNGKGLDLPAMELRARTRFSFDTANCRREVPSFYRCHSRWGDRAIPSLDLGEACGCGGRMLKLHHAAQMFGLPGKPGDFGEKVAEMLAGPEDQRQLGIQYCISDVVTPIQIGFLGGFFADTLGGKMRTNTRNLFLLPEEIGTVIDRPCELEGWMAELVAIYPKLAASRAAIASGNKRLLNCDSEYLTELLKSLVDAGSIDLLFSEEFQSLLKRCVPANQAATAFALTSE